MSCPNDSAFEKFVADKLPPAIEQEIAEHLETCAACSQRAEALLGGEDLLAVKRSTGNSTAADATSHSAPEELRGSLYQLAAGDTALALPPSEPTVEVFRLLTAEPTDDVAGSRLGRFTVRRWLGGGGFGVVFLAHDELLRREVALKLPRAQSLARREVRERFLREAEAAAQLHHPNVVPVFETGEEQGVCYIASAYCPGPTLDAWRADQSEPVPVASAVALVQQLAEAVQHAHDHRVLHRDIKPSNIILEQDPANPDALTPKITDFGLAKLLDAGASEVSMTGSRGMLGTPRYMAPEQAAGDRGVIGPATDVFGLGAVLYELLVGLAPYAGEDQAQTLHRLRYEHVVPPRRLRAELPRDLEAICLKCLEKKPRDRYASARDLADDLRRFREGRPTSARQIGRLEMLRRWIVHQPMLASLLGLLTAGVLTMVGVLFAYNRSLESFNTEMRRMLGETRQAQRAVEAQRTRLRHLLCISKIELAHQAIEENDLRQAARVLEEVRKIAPTVAGGFAWRYLYNQVAAQGRVVENTGADVYDLQFSPSGERFAASGADGMLRIYDGDSFARLVSFGTEQGEINGTCFSPDEKWIATAGDDGTVRLFDSRTGEAIRTIQAHETLAYDLLFTPDGKTLISCGQDRVIRLWDTGTGAPQGVLEGHRESVEAIALAPGGQQLASASSDHTARTWDLSTGRTLHVLQGHHKRVVDVQYSADGDFLLTGSIDHTIRRWRAADGRCVQVEDHVDAICSVAFTGGDSQLIASDRAGTVHVWPLALNPFPAKPGKGGQEKPQAEEHAEPRPSADAEPRPLHSWKAHEGRAWDVAAPAGRAGVLTAGADGRICYWQRPPTAHRSLELTGEDAIGDIAFADPAQVHFIHSDSGLRTWKLATDEQSVLEERGASGERQPRALSMLPRGVLVSAYSDGTIVGRELPSRQLRLRWTPGDAADPWQEISGLAASRDGRRLAVFSFPRDATEVYDVTRREVIGTFKAYSQAMALSGDGSRLAMSDGDDVVVWDVDRHALLHRFRGHTSSIIALRFSPGGRWLASGSKDRNVRLWDLSGDHPPLTLSGHRGEVETVAFSADGRLLASGDGRGELKFWFLPEATELISIEFSEPIHRLAFSPDGRRLAVQSRQQIRILDATASVFRDASPAAQPVTR